MSVISCKWRCDVQFESRCWAGERCACLDWPENSAYPARASPGLRSHWTLPNKSEGTAGCQHSYRPSLSPPRRPPLRSAVRTVHRSGLSHAVCYQRTQTARGDSNGKTEKRAFRSSGDDICPERTTWGENVEKLALSLIQLHLTKTSSVLKKRWKKTKEGWELFQRALNLPSGLDYFCCGCQLPGNTFIWHTLISGQIHDIRPRIGAPHLPNYQFSLHSFHTIQNCVFLSLLGDASNDVWHKWSSWVAPDPLQTCRCSQRLRIKTFNQKRYMFTLRNSRVLAAVLCAHIPPSHPHAAGGFVLVVSTVQHLRAPPLAHACAQTPGILMRRVTWLFWGFTVTRHFYIFT